MTLDELPIEVLFVLVCLGWSAYLGLVVFEARRNRRRDRAERAHHGRPNHEPEHEEHDGKGEAPSKNPEEGCVIHARSVSLPPGIPSIVERLDRWRD